MAAKRTRPDTRVDKNRPKARQDVARAFDFCLTTTDTNRDAAAEVLGVARRTVDAWLRCETAITVEIILACPQLHGAFRQALCTHDHSDGSAPTFAKKTRGAK